MVVHTATSAGGDIAVSVETDRPTRVGLSAATVSMGDEELANRLIRLSTLAVLRRQASGPSPIRSAAQVAAYAATIDF
ncbi:Uncharacterised protein [Mycobacteroides abscessus subsp. abscessus]|nr:Uncharacterised protein [Mycobacteroides abscessus subsp. abscessus]SHQ54239.1 Uncharacterised protein [Mycobacteroides abscessus subsp. abscessus]SHQ56881.1 Uncharacterised protein [Mycobacteroides abscessus subsp. abscessus]SHR18674.1 Uncharacterised protein [Mycobacteroides abscessus subsp. abscessus]SHR18977.1 Uncharacterised protein [Mycobacteroides abscessus subsp. abscessus]